MKYSTTTYIYIGKAENALRKIRKEKEDLESKEKATAETLQVSF